MARIRTIKPEFFTSEDIVALPALARLLYVALWCEADKEGRLAWKPKTLKFRYFPADDCDIEALAAALVDSGLVKLYGDGLAYIPGFAKHQHINPREAASNLPSPDACPTRAPRVSDASARDSDAQGGREGKGREGEIRVTASRGERLPADWNPDADDMAWARKERPDLGPEAEADRFRDYWTAKPGKDGVKLDWKATWRNWIRNARPGQHAATPNPRRHKELA